MNIADKFYNIALAVDVSYFEGLSFVREEQCDTFPNDTLYEFIADLAMKHAVSIDDITNLYSDIQIPNTTCESVKLLTFSDNSTIIVIHLIQNGEKSVKLEFKNDDNCAVDEKL